MALCAALHIRRNVQQAVIPSAHSPGLSSKVTPVQRLMVGPAKPCVGGAQPGHISSLVGAVMARSPGCIGVWLMLRCAVLCVLAVPGRADVAATWRPERARSLRRLTLQRAIPTQREGLTAGCEGPR